MEDLVVVIMEGSDKSEIARRRMDAQFGVLTMLNQLQIKRYSHPVAQDEYVLVYVITKASIHDVLKIDGYILWTSYRKNMKGLSEKYEGC